MELRQLKHFMVLAKLKHFHQAASELNLAQPSLSRSIQKMEDLLGVKLLDRTSRSVALTAYGEVVLEHGDKIVRDVEAMKQEIHALKGVAAGELVVGASAIPSNSIVGPAIGHFINEFPQVSVELHVGDWQALYQQLCKGHLSLFIAETRITELDNQQDIQIIPLPSFEAVFCCRTQHPLARKAEVSLADLRAYPLAIPSALPKASFNQFGELFSKQRTDFSGLVKFAQFLSVKESLTQCDLVALAPNVSIKKEQEEGSLVALKITDMPDIRASFSIVHLNNRYLTPSAEAFIQFLLAADADTEH